MAIEKVGTGEPGVLLVPGGPGLVNSFYRELIDVLARSRAVYTYRPAGTWPDDPGSYPRTVAAAADELAGVIGAVRSEGYATQPFAVLGHSFGAAVLLELICRHPLPPEVSENLERAVVLSGFSSGRMIRSGIEGRVAALPWEFHREYRQRDGEDPAAIPGLLQKYWFPTHFCRAPWPESFQEGLAHLNPGFLAHFLGENLFELSGEILSWDRSADLPMVSVPTLVAGGDLDYFDPEDVASMAASIPGAELWIGEGCSHSPWIEDGAAFYTVLERFLAGG